MFAYRHTGAPIRDRALLIGSLAAVVGLAWVALWLWGRSPYARFLSHGTIAGPDSAELETVLFVLGWLMMTVAMMLPTSVPLVATFGAFVRRRRRPGLLVGLAVAGYVVTWTAVGTGMYLADRVLHAVVDATPWLAAYPQLITGSILIGAGAYQFTPLKYRCLEACRSPLGFIVNRWQGIHERREAFGLGVAHGLYCVGCCWSLAVVMFALGMGNLTWMLAFGAFMAVEKNLPLGRSIGRPLGVVLLLAGLAVLAW